MSLVGKHKTNSIVILCFFFDRRTCTMLGLLSAAMSHDMSAPIKYDVQKLEKKKMENLNGDGNKIQTDCVRKSFPRGKVIWIVDKKKKFFLSECTRYIFNDYLWIIPSNIQNIQLQFVCFFFVCNFVFCFFFLRRESDRYCVNYPLRHTHTHKMREKREKIAYFILSVLIYFNFFLLYFSFIDSYATSIEVFIFFAINGFNQLFLFLFSMIFF